MKGMDLPRTRRGFLSKVSGVLIGSAGFPQLDTEDDESDVLSAEDIWNEITEQNWGYEASGLKEFHEKVGDKGRGLDVVILDRGFDMNHRLFNPVYKEDGIPFKDYHVNIRTINNPRWAEDSVDDRLSRHGTRVAGVVWQAVPNANFHIRAVKTATGSIRFHAPPYTIIRQPTVEFSMPPVSVSDYATALENLRDAAESFDVIVTSLSQSGLQYFGTPYEDVKKIIEKDTVFVTSAGNGTNGWEKPHPVARIEEALSVSGYMERGGLHSGIAPDQATEDKPDIAAPGEEIHTLAGDYGVETSAPINVDSGSSFAAPHVGGIAALLSRHGNAEQVRDAIINTARETTGDDRYGAGRVSMMDAYNELTDGNSGARSSREFRPTATWGTASVRIDAPEYDSVTLSMSDGTEETFTASYSGETLFAYSGFYRMENGEYVDVVDEEYKEFHGVIQEATVTSGDHEVTIENTNENCPEHIEVTPCEVTFEGSTSLSNVRVSFAVGGWKEFPNAEFGGGITIRSPGRRLEQITYQEPLPRGGGESLGKVDISGIDVRYPHDCDVGELATRLVNCNEVVIGEDEIPGPAIHGDVTIEMGGDEKVFEGPFELPAMFTVEEYDTHPTWIEIDRQEWGSTFRFPLNLRGQC